jgi:Common central domain of tyrosinase/Polyphenol oxidase middle domain
MTRTVTRRKFLQQSGAASSALLFADFLKERTRNKYVYVRKNIDSLNAYQIATFRRGVQAMKSRPVTDPTSWLFQANIHGVPFNEGEHPIWNQCEHGTLFFLSWHRMYLYFFERILRAASGDPTFTLPYWNYDKSDAARALPEPFRLPAAESNPLYLTQRRPEMNEGAMMPPSVTSAANAMMLTEFGSSTAFGFTHSLEGVPHSPVHILVGGDGWMSSVPLAARDPIFWLHHANIDRLWNLWLAQGEGRHSPVEDTAWGEASWTFYDETCNQVEITGCEILRAQDQLGYVYEEEPLQIREFCASGLETVAAIPQDKIFVHSQDPARELTSQKMTIAVPVDPGPMATLHESAASKKIILKLENLEADGPTGAVFEVYLNLPSDATNVDYQSIHYAGLLSFFGIGPAEPGKHVHGDGHQRSFEITNVYRRLKERNLWNDQQISLTFIPRGLNARDGRPLPIQVTGRPRFAQVSLVTQ